MRDKGRDNRKGSEQLRVTESSALAKILCYKLLCYTVHGEIKKLFLISLDISSQGYLGHEIVKQSQPVKLVAYIQSRRSPKVHFPLENTPFIDTLRTC